MVKPLAEAVIVIIVLGFAVRQVFAGSIVAKLSVARQTWTIAVLVPFRLLAPGLFLLELEVLRFLVMSRMQGRDGKGRRLLQYSWGWVDTPFLNLTGIPVPEEA